MWTVECPPRCEFSGPSTFESRTGRSNVDSDDDASSDFRNDGSRIAVVNCDR